MVTTRRRADVDFTKAELELLQQFDRNEFFGWFVSIFIIRELMQSACAADSAANARPGSENATFSGDGTSSKAIADVAKSFIADHLPTMDYCDFPELKKLHGGMA